MPIKILINGKEEKLESEMNVLELLKKKNIRLEVVTVELNEKIINGKDYQLTLLKEGDVLEFVFFMGGGGLTQASTEQFDRSEFTAEDVGEEVRRDRVEEEKKWYVYIIKGKDRSL